MAGEGEDPFGFQFNICQPCPSDSVKLQDCPALRLSAVSPDSDSDTDFEQTPLSSTPTELTRIHMVSPPESESDSEEDTPSNDRIAPLENDVFHTPPEHYNRRSSSSSQEFLSQREKVVAVNGVADEQIQSTARVEDGVQIEGDENLEIEGMDGVQLEGDENLEIEGTAELEKSDEDLETETQSSEDLMDVEGIAETEPSLKKYSDLVDELRKAAKKLRGSPSAVTDGSQPDGDVTLRASGMVELDRNDGDPEIQCSQNVISGDSVFRAESNLKKYSVFVDELREFSKKIRGSVEKSKGGTYSTFTNRLQPEGDETLIDSGMAGLGGNDEDSEIHCSQNVTGVNKVVRAETNLNRYTHLVDELREFSKKLIASNEDRKCDMLNHVDCTEESALDKGKITVTSRQDIGRTSENRQLNVETGEKSMYVGFYAGPEERMEEKAAADEEGRVEPCLLNDLDSVSGKCVGGLKDIENEVVSGTHIDLTAMDLEENDGIDTEEKLDKKAVEEPCFVDIRDTAPRKSIGGKRKSRNECISVIDLDSVEENDGTGVQNEELENFGTSLDCEITRVVESKELTDCGSDGVGGGVVNNEKVGEACLVMSSVDLSVKASSKVITLEENSKKQTDGESSLSSKNIKETTNTKETEGFTNEICVSDSNNPCKEVVPGKRRELPSSLCRKENEPSTQKVKKRSWLELLCACEVYFKMDESLKDVDFLETAKRRGLTFP